MSLLEKVHPPLEEKVHFYRPNNKRHNSSRSVSIAMPDSEETFALPVEKRKCAVPCRYVLQSTPPSRQSVVLVEKDPDRPYPANVQKAGLTICFPMSRTER